MPRLAIALREKMRSIERLWKSHRRGHRLGMDASRELVEDGGSQPGSSIGTLSHRKGRAGGRRKQEDKKPMEPTRSDETKVVGSFAYYPLWKVICTEGGACLIAGSAGAMKQYLEELAPERAPRATVRKTRFGEILEGLEFGAAYAFDRESYARFYPLAVDAGLPVEPADFEAANRRGDRFFIVRLGRL